MLITLACRTEKSVSINEIRRCLYESFIDFRYSVCIGEDDAFSDVILLNETDSSLGGAHINGYSIVITDSSILNKRYANKNPNEYWNVPFEVKAIITESDGGNASYHFSPMCLVHRLNKDKYAHLAAFFIQHWNTWTTSKSN